MPEISVIVPVYNAEKFLTQCLDSILKQTFSDFELICVNDGSSDNSKLILDEYKRRDCRIKIIDKENGGLSSARNTGMKKAEGKFIGFMDADDEIEKDFLEKLYKNITGFNTDISMCSVKLFDDKKKMLLDDDYYNFSIFPESFDNKVFSYADTKDFITDVPVMAWNKLYRKSFLDSTGAEFPDGLIFEDGAFFFKIFFKTKRVSIVREPLYTYRINREGSIIQKGGKQFIDIIDIVNIMFDELKKTEIFEDVKYDFFKRKADDVIYRYSFLTEKQKPEFAEKFRQECSLSDEKVFNYLKIKNKMRWTYKGIMEIKNKKSLLNRLKEFFKYSEAD